MEYRICCYDNLTLEEVHKKIDLMPVSKEDTYYIDLVSDPAALQRTHEHPRVIVLSNCAHSNIVQTVSRISNLYINYNPLLICLDCNLDFVKYLLRYDSLREKISFHTKLNDDVKVLALEVLAETDFEEF